MAIVVMKSADFLGTLGADVHHGLVFSTDNNPNRMHQILPKKKNHLGRQIKNEVIFLRK